MVNIRTVRQSNAALKAGPAGLVCVCVGATSGIGASTLKELVKDLNTPTVYVIGRSRSRFSGQLTELKALNPDVVVEFVETEISLLGNVDSVCERIATKESKVDLLYMSAGFLAFGGPNCEHTLSFPLVGPSGLTKRDRYHRRH